MSLCYSNMPCCTWINISDIMANTRNQQTSYLYKTGWWPFRYIFCFIWCQLVWFTEVSTEKIRLFFGIILLIVVIVASPVYCVLSVVLNATAVHQMVSLSLEKQKHSEQQKLLPENWLHNLWVSLCDKSSLTLMVLKMKLIASFQLISHIWEHDQEGIVKLIQPRGH